MIEEKEELQGQLIASGQIVGSIVGCKGEKGEKGDPGEPGSPGSPGTPGQDGFSPIASISKTGKIATITITDSQGTTTAEIRDGEDGSGSGDMLKATYDTNDNGIVDNAEKVNDHTVLSDVPANAVFTDTTYTAGTGIEITAGNVINNTQTSAEWGNISGDIDDQTDLQNILADKIDSSDLAAVATSGSYNDLSDKPSIMSGLTELSYGNSTWNDFITAYNNNQIVYCKASSGVDPSVGEQTRKAFMAYVSNPNTPTSVEFQYIRSIATHTSSQQGDQVFVYTLTSANGGTWSVTTREMSTKIVAGTNMTSSYSSGVLTLNAEAESIPVQDTAPSNPSEDDLWIDTSEPEEMQEAIVNEYSESTSETYSCDYVNDVQSDINTKINTLAKSVTFNNEWRIGYKPSAGNFMTTIPINNPSKHSVTFSNNFVAEIYDSGWKTCTVNVSHLLETELGIRLTVPSGVTLTDGNVYLIRFSGTVTVND